MRALPRVTVRATSRTLATWAAICEVHGFSAHAGFAALVDAFALAHVNHRATITRRAREIRRERFNDMP